MWADAFRHAFQAGLWRDAAAAPAPEPAKHHADKLVRAAALEDARDWAGLSQLTDLRLSLNEGPAAARSLLAAIPLAPPEALDDLLEAAYAVLRVADAADAVAILEALRDRLPGERDAFDDAGPAPDPGDAPPADADLLPGGSLRRDRPVGRCRRTVHACSRRPRSAAREPQRARPLHGPALRPRPGAAVRATLRRASGVRSLPLQRGAGDAEDQARRDGVLGRGVRHRRGPQDLLRPGQASVLPRAPARA